MKAIAGRWALIVVLGALLAHAVWALAAALSGGWAVDFLAFDTGARLAAQDGGHLYSPDVQTRVEAGLLGYEPHPFFPSYFLNPPFAALLLRPLIGLSLQQATDVFVIASAIALVVAARLLMLHLGDLPRTMRAAVVGLSVLSFPGSYALLLGQWGALLLLAAATALWLIDRGRLLAAGALVSLLLIKPQLMWMLVIVLVIGQQWRILAGMGLGALIAGVSSLSVTGLGGGQQLVALLNHPQFVATGPISRSLPRVASLLTGGRVGNATAALVLAAAACVPLVRFRRVLAERADVALGVGILLSLLLAPHVNDHDLLLLAVPATVAAPRFPRLTVVTLFAVSAIFALMQAIGIPGASDPDLDVLAVAAAAFYVVWDARRPVPRPREWAPS